ncbi:ABC transporter permease [Gordonia sp. NB41Y]|uniref:ABC transporter permease n=1 Tax=Gordonia sp. NB41Y TaxID=875808 RepID=UPI0002BDA6E0|nr:ABC transporter permease [Gordonia sp. NB41Y]EMP10446.1 hypothetical protein ISGA_4330 [Gordonia sp. NB41Y]WLP88430.1 ABC transporter permease [Gordonia sp. NB41Y]
MSVVTTEGKWTTALRNIQRPSVSLSLIGLIASGLVVLIVIGWLGWPGLFTSYSPIDGTTVQRLQPPGSAHWFGTDHQGRDVYARVVYGASKTIGGAAIAIVIGLFGGLILGVVAATAGGWIESVVMRIVEVLLAIPAILVALCLVSAFGPGVVQIAVAIGVHSIAVFTRLARSRVLEVRESEYVEAAALVASGYWSIMFRHVLPNSAGPVVALLAIEFANAVLSIGALGFLGYGALPPTPEWGVIISDGRGYLANAWWISLLPSLVLVLVVLAFNRISSVIEEKGNF